MSLFDHARAARILGDAFREQCSGNMLDPENVVFFGLSVAFRVAADRMIAADHDEALDHGCTLIHRGTGKCPACNAPRTP